MGGTVSDRDVLVWMASAQTVTTTTVQGTVYWQTGCLEQEPAAELAGFTTANNQTVAAGRPP